MTRFSCSKAAAAGPARRDYGARFDLLMRFDLCSRIASLQTFRAYIDFPWKIKDRGAVAVYALIGPHDHVFEGRQKRRGPVLQKLPSQDIFFGGSNQHQWPALRIDSRDLFPVGGHSDFDNALDSRSTGHDRIEGHLPRNHDRKLLFDLLSERCEWQHST